MNMFVKKDLFPPHKLAVAFGTVAVVAMLLASFTAKDPMTVWLIGSSCLLLFSIANNGMSFFAESYKYYLRNSLYSFFALFAVVLGVAYLCSGISVYDAKSYKIIVGVILMANFVFIAMILFVKGIFSALTREGDEF